MNVDTERTVCLEDISTMKQKNNWCSWCVRVFVGSEEGDWKTCGVGILAFKIGSKVINTLDQLNKELSQRGPNNPSELKAVVKIQKGLTTPTNREEASESMKRRVRDPDPNQEFIMNCDLREATNFEMEKSMIIYWTQRDKDLNISISFLQCEIFVESWQIVSAFTGNDYKADFVFPSVANLDKMLAILSNPGDKENFKILLSCFIVNEQYLNQLFTIFVKYKTNESISESDSHDKKNVIVQRYKILSKINDIVKFILEDENPDLTLSLMREGIYECLLELIGITHSSNEDNINYLKFYKNQCRRREIFDLSDKFKTAVETKFRIVYLKDYVFANSLNDKYLNKLKYLIVRINLAIVYNILEDFKNVWSKLFKLIEEDVESANVFFNEFFQIYTEVGVSIMSNVSMVYFASDSHKDILKLIKRILDKEKEDISANEFKILYLCFEITAMFARPTVKGTARVFGEEIEDENGVKFKFAELVKKGLGLSDTALTSSILELFSKLLEISQLPEKRKKFVHSINNYVLVPLMELLDTPDGESREDPPNLIKGILVLFLNNLIEDKNKIKNEKVSKISQMMSTLQILKKTKLLQTVSRYLEKYSNHSEFCIMVTKIIKIILETKDEELKQQILDLNFLDLAFNMIIKHKKRRNLIYSSALSTFQFMHTMKMTKLVDSFVEKFEEKIKENYLEPDEKVFRNLMSFYRTNRNKSEIMSDEVEGNFASCASSVNHRSSFDDSNLNLEHLNVTVPPRPQKFNVHNINDDELELFKMKQEMVLKDKMRSKKDQDGQTEVEEMKEDDGDGPFLGKREKSSS